MHYYRKGELKYLVGYYSELSDYDLAYEYVQPDCIKCSKWLDDNDCLPKWCSDCCTFRDDDGPLAVEITSRDIDVWEVLGTR